MRRALTAARVPPLALALALALTQVASAHLDRERPHIQETIDYRAPELTLNKLALHIDLLRVDDPLADIVTYDIDPTKGLLASEYRHDPSSAVGAFKTRWTVARILEYHDTNANGLFEPKTDAVARSWRWSAYTWNVTGPRDVRIADNGAKDVVWHGALPGGPTVLFETGVLGVPAADEGARALPQDIFLYLDVSSFPGRATGDLYAMEFAVLPPPGATVTHDVVENGTAANQTAGILVDAPARQAGLDWGAQATLGGVERNLNATMDEPDADGERTFHIHFPLFDGRLRMIFVESVEYVVPPKRGADAAGVALLVVAIGALALAHRD
jgi:hypothetical protein